MPRNYAKLARGELRCGCSEVAVDYHLDSPICAECLKIELAGAWQHRNQVRKPLTSAERTYMDSTWNRLERWAEPIDTLDVWRDFCRAHPEFNDPPVSFDHQT